MDDGGDRSLPAAHPHYTGAQAGCPNRPPGNGFAVHGHRILISLEQTNSRVFSTVGLQTASLLTGENLGLHDRLRHLNGDGQGCDIRELRLQVIIDVRMGDVDPSRARPKRQPGHITHVLLAVIRGVPAFHPDNDLFISGLLDADAFRGTGGRREESAVLVHQAHAFGA